MSALARGSAGARGLLGLALIAAGLLGRPLWSDERRPATDWPVYRHDRALSGKLRIIGNATESPAGG